MSLAVLADHMASKGRGPDSMLIHMSPREVQGLQALAEHHGGTLTINPDTGLPEANFLEKLLPTIIGAGISFFSQGAIDPMTAAAMVGGVETVRTGDIGKGISAGLGAYGGANLTAGLTSTGDTLLSQGPTTLAANEAARLAGEEAVRNGITQGFTPEMLEAARMEAIETAGNNTARISASPFENLKAGAESAAKNPMQYLKANAIPLAAAFGPAILSGENVKSGLPQTTTKPGMITPYSYFNGQYIAGNPYQATPTRGAEGGLMGMNDGGYNPGMLDFTQKSEPVMRMAEGGIAGYANGGPLDVNNPIYQYFAKPETQALLASGNDAAIADALVANKFNLADIGAATGTQNKQADYERRFVRAEAQPTTDTGDFMRAANAVGLQGQGLATALQNSGLSAADQYALTHSISDANINLGTLRDTDFYRNLGYTTNTAPGDQGGIEGLNLNINEVATRLQNQINAGTLTVQDAQRLANNEMTRVGVNQNDLKNATGKDLFNLFKDKPTTVVNKNCGVGYHFDEATQQCVKDTVIGDVVCGPGYKKSIDGKTCVPDTTVVTQETQCATGFHYDPVLKQCVKNLDATQTTTTNVTTPTSISTAASTALPVGVSGAGITTINPNGTVTTRPDLSLGMGAVRDAYEKGGGSLGVNKNIFVPKTYKELEDRFKLTGGSKQAMDYLTGKTKYSPVPYTEDGQIAKSYAESVMKMPVASSSKMYIFKNGKYEVNPDYAIPTYDKDGKKSSNLTNADVKTFMDNKPSTDAFYTWATTNNLSPEQIALASGRPINEISKLFTGAKDLVGEDGKVDQTKVDEKAAEDIKTNWDEDAYLAAHPDVKAELTTGKSVTGKPVQFTSGYEHWLKYGKDAKWEPTVKKAGGGLAALTMAHGGMMQQFNLGDYSDGGRLLRGPGDGVSDSIPASIGGKRPARLADGEFVVPARIVSELGNGSTEAGARKLYAMMDRVQSARRGTVGKGRVAKNSRSDKYLPA